LDLTYFPMNQKLRYKEECKVDAQVKTKTWWSLWNILVSKIFKTVTEKAPKRLILNRKVSLDLFINLW